MKNIFVRFFKQVFLPSAIFLFVVGFIGFVVANPAPYPSTDPTQLIYQIYIILSVAAYTFICIMLWWISETLDQIKELLKKKPKTNLS